MAGLELDVDAGPLQVVAQLAASFDGLTSQMKASALAEKRRLDHLRTQVPIDVTLKGSGFQAGGTTTSFGINLDGPQAGFYWLVRRIIVGPVGVGWPTSSDGTTEVYVTPMAGMVGMGSASGGSNTGAIAQLRQLSDLVDQSATIPNKAFYSNHQIVVQPSEKLVIVVNPVASTPTVQFIATAQVEVHRAVSAAEQFSA